MRGAELGEGAHAQLAAEDRVVELERLASVVLEVQVGVERDGHGVLRFVVEACRPRFCSGCRHHARPLQKFLDDDHRSA
jgi:hypothetical protein